MVEEYAVNARARSILEEQMHFDDPNASCDDFPDNFVDRLEEEHLVLLQSCTLHL